LLSLSFIASYEPYQKTRAQRISYPKAEGRPRY
jgi:hypothetical protein